MGLRKCNDCGEMVDEARAFCDACGNPFVHEIQPAQSGSPDSSIETVQFNETMFGAILADMGLDLSNPPNIPELPPQASQPALKIEPLNRSDATAHSPNLAGTKPPPGGSFLTSRVKWWLLVGIGLIIVLTFVLIVLILILLFWFRLI